MIPNLNTAASSSSSSSASSSSSTNPKKRRFKNETDKTSKRHHTDAPKAHPKYEEFLDMLNATKRVWAEAHHKMVNPLFSRLESISKLDFLDLNQREHVSALFATCKPPSAAASSADTQKANRIFEAYQAVEKEKSLEGGCQLLELAFAEKQRTVIERMLKESLPLFDLNHDLFSELLDRALNILSLDQLITILKVIPNFSLNNSKVITLVQKLGALALKHDSTEMCGLLVKKCVDLHVCDEFVTNVAGSSLKLTSILLTHESVRANVSLRMFERAKECRRWDIVDEILKLARGHLSEVQMIPHFVKTLEAQVKEMVDLFLKYQIGITSTVVLGNAIKHKNPKVIEAIKQQKIVPSLHQYLNSLGSIFSLEELLIFTALRDLGADPNELYLGETVFTVFLKRLKLFNQNKDPAIRNNWEECSKHFLSRLKVNPALKGAGAKNALEAAIEIEDLPSLPIVSMCLKQIKKKKSILNEALKVTVSLKSGVPEHICEALITAGADNVQEALHTITIGEKYDAVAESLISNGANPFIKGDQLRPHLLDLCLVGKFKHLEPLMQLNISTTTPYETDELGFGYATYLLAGCRVSGSISPGTFDKEIDDLNDYLEAILKEGVEQNYTEIVGSYLLCLTHKNKFKNKSWKKLFQILHVALPFHNGVMLSYEELSRIYNGVHSLIEECAVIQNLTNTKSLLKLAESAFHYIVERFGFEVIYPIQSSRGNLPEEISKQVASIDYRKAIWEMYQEILTTPWEFPTTLTNTEIRAELEKLLTFLKAKQTTPYTLLEDETYHIALQQAFSTIFPNKEITIQKFLYENLIQNDVAIDKFLKKACHFITICRFLDYVFYRKKKLGVSPTDDSLREKFYAELEEVIRTVICFAKNPPKKELARVLSSSLSGSSSSSSASSSSQQTTITRTPSQSKVYDSGTAYSLICTIMRGAKYCTANWSEAIDVLSASAQKEIQIRGLKTSGDMLTKRGLEKLVALQLESLRENIIKLWANERTKMKIATDFRADPHNARIALGDEVHYERAALQQKGTELGLSSKVTEHVLNWNPQLNVHFEHFFTQKYIESMVRAISDAINISKEIPTMTVQEWMKTRLLKDWELQRFKEIADNAIAALSKKLTSLKKKDSKSEKELDAAILESILKELPALPSLSDFSDSFLRAIQENSIEKIAELIRNATEKQRETEFATTLYNDDFTQIKRTMIYEMLIELKSIRWGGTEHLARLKIAGEDYKRRIAAEERERAAKEAAAAAAAPQPLMAAPPIPYQPVPIAALLPQARQH